MIERKLRINLEGLWDNPNQRFTVRYKDINKNSQKNLSERIKEIAPQKKLRNQSTEDIEKVLHEINPIIFSEHISVYPIRRNLAFGKQAAIYTAGYRFKDLCQAIYILLCSKKEPTRDQIKKIAYQSNTNWQKVIEYIDQRIQETEENQPITPIENLGIEDIHRAGEEVRIRTNREETLRFRPIFTPDPNYDQIITHDGITEILENNLIRDTYYRAYPNEREEEEPLQNFAERFRQATIEPIRYRPDIILDEIEN